MAEPEEVADAILYLASDASPFVTGSEPTQNDLACVRVAPLCRAQLTSASA